MEECPEYLEEIIAILKQAFPTGADESELRFVAFILDKYFSFRELAHVFCVLNDTDYADMLNTVYSYKSIDLNKEDMERTLQKLSEAGLSDWLANTNMNEI